MTLPAGQSYLSGFVRDEDGRLVVSIENLDAIAGVERWFSHESKSAKFTNETAGTVYIGDSGSLLGAGSDHGVGRSMFYFDPADYAVDGKTTRCKLRGSALSNATDPTGTFTFKLVPVTDTAGADGVVSITVGAALGNAVAANPGAGGQSHATSEFDAPTAGWYVFSVANSVNIPVGCDVAVLARLQVAAV